MTVSLKDAAPSWAKSLYRGSRLGVRRLRRLLGGDKVRCRVRGTEILLGVSSEIEQYRAETYASKEPETLDWLDKNLRDGDVLFDVGSNIGVYSLYAAKRQPGCRVYAFEPAAQNFSRLCRNLALNGLENVTPCNFPLSDKEAFERFFVSDLEAGSAFHSIGSFNPDQPAAAAQRLVQGVLAATIDGLVARAGLASPTLLKIDVDGLEDRILEGARSTLAGPSLRGVLVEVTHREGAAPSSDGLLGRRGFELSAKSEWSIKRGGFVSRNHLYERLGGPHGR